MINSSFMLEGDNCTDITNAYDKISRLNEENSSLKEKLKISENEIAQKTQRIAKLQNELTSLQSQYQELLSHVVEIKQVGTHYKEKYKNAQLELTKQINNRNNIDEQEYDNIIKRHSSEISDLKRQFEKDMQTVIDNNIKEINRLKDNNESQINALTEKFETEKRDIKNDYLQQLEGLRKMLDESGTKSKNNSLMCDNEVLKNENAILIGKVEQLKRELKSRQDKISDMTHRLEYYKEEAELYEVIIKKIATKTNVPFDYDNLPDIVKSVKKLASKPPLTDKDIQVEKKYHELSNILTSPIQQQTHDQSKLEVYTSPKLKIKSPPRKQIPSYDSPSPEYSRYRLPQFEKVLVSVQTSPELNKKNRENIANNNYGNKTSRVERDRYQTDSSTLSDFEPPKRKKKSKGNKSGSSSESSTKRSRKSDSSKKSNTFKLREIPGIDIDYPLDKIINMHKKLRKEEEIYIKK